MNLAADLLGALTAYVIMGACYAEGAYLFLWAIGAV